MLQNQEKKKEIPLENVIEALLFVSPSPVSVSRIASAMEVSESRIKEALDILQERYKKNRGLVIQRYGNKMQFVTNPELSETIEKFLGIEVTTTLSQASLEALAIIAYRQPVTRPEIDEIRGVNSDGVVRNLLSKGLIEEVGRVEGVGRPILYGTTSDFLNYFGLTSLDELPAFEVLPSNETKTNGVLKD